jgi:LuxR family maltose regulon positive regulatory protein
LLDFLRIKQGFKAEELQDLYRRLGEWHLGKKEYIAAYSCLYRAGEVERILADIYKPDRNINNIIWFDGHLKMFKTAPQELLDEYPIAYLLYIFISLWIAFGGWIIWNKFICRGRISTRIIGTVFWRKS